MIAMPIYLQARRQVNLVKKSMTSAIGAMESQMCMVDRNQRIQIEYPMKKVKEFQSVLSLPRETNIGMNDYFKKMALLV